ncbi:MAG: TRM11 family SAM-dependent methyltransferase, partial [Candidatus Saccharimonadales bacterium]
NLAAADKPPTGRTLLDPFCGTGVILQEALLMGFDAQGTDIDQRMVDYSSANIDWFKMTLHPEIKASVNIALADATKAQCRDFAKSPSFVASETYLGRPFTSKPNPEILAKTISECNLIIKKFLQNIHGQVKPGTRFCLAVPAWQIKPGIFKHLPLIDQIRDLGYNRVSFERTKGSQLIYHRENQIVARELLVITKELI